MTVIVVVTLKPQAVAGTGTAPSRAFRHLPHRVRADAYGHRITARRGQVETNVRTQVRERRLEHAATQQAPGRLPGRGSPHNARLVTLVEGRVVGVQMWPSCIRRCAGPSGGW